ncbi:MAG: nucleotide disphospho-sugar-binding domain-containing protein [Betaproteobacteria bacterium]
MLASAAMAHIHLAWELGSGLGHVSRLKPIAIELARRGHEVSMSLRDLVVTRSAWLPLDLACVQAPVFLHQTVGLPKRAASLAEIALAHGYLEGGVLDALFEGWRALIARFGPALVVADYAPTATLAARALGIPAMAIGLGFAVPPAGRPLPSIRWSGELEPGRLAAAESRLVHSANHALRATGVAPLTRGSELFRGDRALLCDWPELDCYARGPLADGETWFGPNFDPAAGDAPRWPLGEGPRVFAYLKGTHRDTETVLRALVDRGCRTLCYLRGIDSGKPPPVEHALLAYSPGPVNLEAALDEAALCVCHAGGGTTAQSLLAGVPLLLLPSQAEQELNARAIERLGAGVAVVQGRAPGEALARLLDEGHFRGAARSFAERHRGFSHERQTRDLCDTIERTLPRGANGPTT